MITVTKIKFSAINDLNCTDTFDIAFEGIVKNDKFLIKRIKDRLDFVTNIRILSVKYDRDYNL